MVLKPETEKADDNPRLNLMHHNDLVNNIIRLFYKSEEMTDVTLATETQDFKVHKLILSACSKYFRKLFEENSCEHPIVFFKDIPAAHMEPLIEYKYMYTGVTSVRKVDLNDFLKSARSLQIDSLEAILSNTKLPERKEDENGNVTESRSSSAFIRKTSNAGKRKAGGGRKSSNPKKLCRDGSEMRRSNPMIGMVSAYLPKQTNVKPALSPEKKRQASTSLDRLLTPTMSSCSHDDIAVSDDEGELVVDRHQPLDFSISSPSPAVNKSNPEIKTNSVLKVKSLESLKKDEEHENKGPSLSMAAAMGLDFAAQLQNVRNQYFAQVTSPAWQKAPNTPQIGQIVKKERTPMGGIRTGKIGDNGKESVECEECGKVLADPSSLYRHKRIHTGERPHKCPFCLKEFLQRYNMKQHIKGVHRKDKSPEEIVAACA